MNPGNQREFGPFLVGEIQANEMEPDVSFRAYVDRKLAENKALHTAIDGHFKQAGTVDFAEIVSCLLRYGKLVLPSDRSDTLVFKGYITAYLSAKDANAWIQPLSYLIAKAKKTGDSRPANGDVAVVGGAFIVKRVESGSSWQKAGILQGDKIISYGELVLSEHAIDTIAAKVVEIQAKEKEPTLEVERAIGNGKSRRIKLPIPKLAAQEIPHVSDRLIFHGAKTLLYIKLTTFDALGVCNKVADKIKTALLSYTLGGLVLDLRGNTGGYGDEGRCLLSLFLGPSRVVEQLRPIDSEAKSPLLTESTGIQVVPDFVPLVVLVDGNSASASEIVVGALRDYSRAVLVGQRTFGKGSSQEAETWGDSAVKRQFIYYRTKKVFYSPFGTAHNRVGYMPDFIVPWRSGATADEDFFARSEFYDTNFTKPEADGPIPPKDIERNGKIGKCLDMNWISKEEKRLFGTVEQSDLQMLYGVEVLRCMH